VFVIDIKALCAYVSGCHLSLRFVLEQRLAGRCFLLGYLGLDRLRYRRLQAPHPLPPGLRPARWRTMHGAVWAKRRERFPASCTNHSHVSSPVC
jgi:hypothetical protein